MFRSLVACSGALLLLSACAGQTAPAPTTAAVTTTTTTATTSAVSEATVSVGLPCERPLFRPSILPDRVGDEAPAPAAVEVDQWTALPGTSLAIWTDEVGNPVVALVRGALPPERYSGPQEVIEVRGVDAAVGPLSENMWAVAWYEGPDRCDLYTLYVYPPTGRDEVVAIAGSLSG